MASAATAAAVEHARKAAQLLAEAELVRPAGLAEQLVLVSNAHAATSLAWAKIAANQAHAEYRGRILSRPAASSSTRAEAR